MLEIEVFFGFNTVGDKTDVLVQPEPAASHSGDDIIWHFHSLDDNVANVEIEFKDSGNKFFDSRNGKTHQRSAKVDKGKKGAHGHILGTAPPNGGGTAKNKYTIKAYDGTPGTVGTKVLYEMDPTVVTCDP